MTLHNHHAQMIYERGFSQTHLDALCKSNGRPAVLESLSPEQIQADWLDRFPAMHGNAGGALLLRFNTETVSLKPDQPDWDEEHQRFKKYLYAVRKNGQQPGDTTQPWVPSKPPTIATEGLFDALACTALIGIPCAAATAPSHIRRSKFPPSIKTYISDADVPFHHSPSLLPVVIEQCREKGLRLAHLPRNPEANYAYTGARIPEDCKWGMEEWARYWTQNNLDPQVELQQIIDNAQEPFEYLRQIFAEYQQLGVIYPDHQPILENAAKAIVAASKKAHKRRILRDQLHLSTTAPITWIDQVILSKDPDYDPGEQEPSEWDIRVQAAKDSGNGDPVAIDAALSTLLNQRAIEVINSSRPIREQKSALKRVANSLGFKPDNNFISDLYAQHDTTAAAYEPDVEPGSTFVATQQEWLLHEVFILGLNLLVGMPGAGKSRLLVALIRAYLNDQPSFIGRGLRPGSKQKVLLVGTDQDRQQWGALLEEQGLATITNRFTAENGTDQVEYKLHPSIYLKTSGGCFSLDADGLRWIRNWCQSNPGGLLIIDSLSAVLPAGVSEDNEAAGRLMRQIEVSRQACPCITTHHSKKSSATAGELGVYSGSGHGSIDRAVSRFIGLGYETHKENGIEKLHEDSPRRVLTSQKRGAGNQRIVLENGHRNTWEFIGTAAEMRELRREDEEGPAEERLKGWKLEAWKCSANEWMETSALFSRVDSSKAKQATADKQFGRALRELRDDHSLLEFESPSAHGAEGRWRRSIREQQSPRMKKKI